MPRIIIDENGYQTGVYSNYGGKGVPHAILVDNIAPSSCHKLKVDYQSFTGEDQWELDTVAQWCATKTCAYETYQATLLQLKSEEELNQLLQKINQITSEEYISRLETIKLDLETAKTTYTNAISEDSEQWI